MLRHTQKTPTKERDLILPIYPYAFSKYIGEELIKHYSKVYKIKFSSLRLFNVYGTRSRTNSAYGAALGVFMRQKIANKNFTVVGDGKQKRDFIHVKDVCDAFIKATFCKQKNQIYNVGFGYPNSVNYLLKLIKGKKNLHTKKTG